MFESVAEFSAGQGGRERVVADGDVLLDVVGRDGALGNGAYHEHDGIFTVVSCRDQFGGMDDLKELALKHFLKKYLNITSHVNNSFNRH